MALTLFELAGADPALRFSPHCWKTRMALAHKGLEAERLPWRFTEGERIGFSGQGRVPVLVDGEDVVSDSWRIALHLEERHPDRPPLFGGPAAVPLAHFTNAWADATLLPAVARLIALDIHDCLADRDRAYFRASREARFGMTLEAVVADRPAHLAALAAALAPLRLRLAAAPYLSGEGPAYADYCVFGLFMWARCVSGIALLLPDDPVAGWRDSLLDRFDGMARNAPTHDGGIKAIGTMTVGRE